MTCALCGVALILREISSPEPAGNGPPGGFWYWWSPGWVLVLVVLEGTKPRVANPRVGSGTGFGGPGGGSDGPGVCTTFLGNFL